MRGFEPREGLALRPDVKTITDPYSGEELVAFPALSCDVAVIHALVADKRGNARLNNMSLGGAVYQHVIDHAR